MKIHLIFAIFVIFGTVYAQDDDTGATEKPKEECEEAWMYLDFLKEQIRYALYQKSIRGIFIKYFNNHETKHLARLKLGIFFKYFQHSKGAFIC